MAFGPVHMTWTQDLERAYHSHDSNEHEIWFGLGFGEMEIRTSLVTHL